MDDTITEGAPREGHANTGRITVLFGNPCTFDQTQWEGVTNPSLVVAKSTEERILEKKAGIHQSRRINVTTDHQK